MANKIKYGLRSVYYAKATPTTTGSLTYATPVAIPGAVNLSLSQEGDRSIFYADDVEYYVSQNNSGYSGTLEVALLPESFKTDILLEENQNGVYVEHSDDVPAEFALLFEFQGDESATRHALFRCIASRPDVNGATKEASIEPQTETLNLTALPRINDFVVKARAPYTTSGAYTTWFTSVFSAT